MPSLTMLFTLFMMPGVCLLITSFIVARLEQDKDAMTLQS